jgi:hypothetical protein
MKIASALFLVLGVGVGVVGVVACGGAPKPAVATTTITAAPVLKEDSRSAAERWAESKMDKEIAETKKQPREALDPLSESGALEAASIPKVELTPAKELRGKSRGELDAAIGVVKSAATVDEAAKKLVARLGKPTWIENGQKRVWVANDGARCHRLVLDADGSVEVQAATRSESIMLTALARQSACTGEITRGVPGSK